MPLQIRPYQQQQTPQSGGMPRAQVLPQVGIGEAIYRLGATAEQVNNEFTKTRREVDLNDRIGRATTELVELEQSFETDQDYKTAPDRFKQRAEDIRTRHLDGIDDAVVKQAFTRQFQTLQITKWSNVSKSSIAKQKDYDRASLDTSMDLYATQAANARSPEERALFENQARIAIAGAQTSGSITAVDAGQRERKFLTRLDEATVLRDMAANPSITADKLALDPTYASNIDPVQRERWVDQAYRRAESERTRREAAEEKDSRKRGDELLKDAYAKLEKGRLTREDVETLRSQPGVSPAEYRALLKGLKEGPSQKNDPAAYADLQTLLYTNPAEARRKALQYHKSGLIKNEVLGSVMGTASGLERQGGPRTPYERERAHITQVLKPSEMVSDPAAQARYALAVREYDDFNLGGQRTPEELRTKATEITGRFAMVNMEDLARRTSLGYQNSPQQVLDGARAEGLRLQQQLDKKQITKAEFDKKMAGLNQARVAAEAALNAQGASGDR